MEPHPEENTIAPYVVKVFTPKQILQQNAVAKEVFGSVLAKAFDLPVPDFALIDFGNDFIETLLPENKAILQNKDKRLKFGSKLAEGFSVFDTTNLSSGKIKSYDIGSVFAFDNLVWNLDRGGPRNKPNLLVSDYDYLLIDHELIFPFADDPNNDHNVALNNFRQVQWKYPYENHLFHPYLKKMRGTNKQDVFETFHDYLRNLNVNLLDEPHDFLQENGHPTGNPVLIKNYLTEIKHNSTSFIQF
ncbi:MAG: hypothetical protein K9J37_23445 [Saprospiraceae bacterium]|nr:hypothetical protein [Saprospiraceae bacterium]MCF8252881.1 hypothetical protein [Saprospiraceae bacterium]MCF8443317.1 hypothetical protein [Saprospiraceae bacterium]